MQWLPCSFWLRAAKTMMKPAVVTAVEEKPGGVTDVTPVTSDLTVNLTTDKACYKPGETVSFTADALPAGAKIRYRTLNKVISEQAIAGSSWTWTAPATDFTGYLADVYRTKEDGTEVILGTIAVDVSSDWTRFPRYGFVATFDASKTESKIQEEMAFLNRCHTMVCSFRIGTTSTTGR